MFSVPHVFQVSVFVKSIGLGALIGIIYFFFIILRRSGISKTPIVIVQDVLFFSLAAVATFMFIFEVNAGEVRFFIFAGAAMGFCLIYIFPLKSLGSFCNKFFVKTRKKFGKFSVKKILKKQKKIQKNYCIRLNFYI